MNAGESEERFPPEFSHKITNSSDRVVQILSEGGVAIIPAETILGLSCDAHNEQAIHKIMRIKKRSGKQGFIILVTSESMAKWYSAEFDPHLYSKIKANFWGEPITIIWQKGTNVPPSILGDDGSIAIRIVDKPHLCEIINKFGKAIVSTSVNFTGEKPATSIDTVPYEILKEVDVIYYRANIQMTGKPSRIIKVIGERDYEIIR